MASGRAGAAIALLAYGLVLTFLRPVSTNTFLNCVKFNPQHLYGKLFPNNIDFGYGRHVLAVTFIFPSLYYRVKKHSKPPARLRHSDALIIIFCLLLSGDIHPCPGPFHTKMAEDVSIMADTIHTSTVSKVRTCCGESLRDYTQPSNLPFSGAAGVVVFARGVVAGVGAARPGGLGCRLGVPVRVLHGRCVGADREDRVSEGAAVDVGLARDIAAGVGCMEVERPIDGRFCGPHSGLRGLSGAELGSDAAVGIFGSAGLSVGSLVSAEWRRCRSTEDF